MLIGPWAVQDGLGIDVVRSFFRLAVYVRFVDPLGLLLGSFWDAPGAVLGPLGLSLGLFWGTPGSKELSTSLFSLLFSSWSLLSSLFPLLLGLSTWAGGL